MIKMIKQLDDNLFVHKDKFGIQISTLKGDFEQQNELRIPYSEVGGLIKYLRNIGPTSYQRLGSNLYASNNDMGAVWFYMSVHSNTDIFLYKENINQLAEWLERDIIPNVPTLCKCA